MAYYLRVLTPSDRCVPLSVIRETASKAARDATVEVTHGSEEDWTEAVVGRRGNEVLALERNPVRSGSLGAEEVQEFAEEIAEALPRSAAKWLLAYLPSVKTIYALQILFETSKVGWKIVGAVHDKIWRSSGGIIQADGEGFSNESGSHVLWQFSDSATGAWEMAVLDEKGAWIKFRMDLGNPEHRHAFQAGGVPAGAKRL